MGEAKPRHALVVNVDGIVGSSVQEVVADMIRLAGEMRTLVACNINGVNVCVSAASDLDETGARYQRAVDTNGKFA